MEFQEVVSRRRMVRRFDPDHAVDGRRLRRALTNALRAPSAGFSQGWDFVVLTDPTARETFWSVTTAESSGPDDAWLRGVRAAPALVLCCSDRDTYLERYARPDKGWTDRDETDWPIPYWDVDTGMAALLMLLTAVDDDLGALFFGVPTHAREAVHDAFAIPASRRIVGVVAIGHPVPAVPRRTGRRRSRRPATDVVHDGRFGAGPPSWL